MSTLSFDAAATAYDRFMGRWSRLWLPALFEAAGVRPGVSVLDVATGTGEAVLAAAALDPTTRVVGTDLSVPMLRAARAKMAGRTAAFAAMDGQVLACRDAVFDVVLCLLGLMFFPDPLRGLREFHRALRPGGRVALSVWSTVERAPFPGVLLEILRPYLPAEGAAIEQAFSLGEPGRLERLLAQAGFEAVAVAREPRRLVFEGFEDFWAPIEAGGSRASQAYLKLDAATRSAVREEVVRRMSRFERDGRLVVDTEALVGSGRRARRA